jgi:hypothetical protein
VPDDVPPPVAPLDGVEGCAVAPLEAVPLVLVPGAAVVDVDVVPVVDVDVDDDELLELAPPPPAGTVRSGVDVGTGMSTFWLPHAATPTPRAKTTASDAALRAGTMTARRVARRSAGTRRFDPG